MIDIAMMIYDRVGVHTYVLLASHILSCMLFFAATFKVRYSSESRIRKK